MSDKVISRILAQEQRKLNRALKHSVPFRNPFAGLLIRRGRVVQIAHGFNDVTIEGKNYLLDVAFGNSSPISQIDPWYIGLISNSPTPSLAEGDTLASHAGWTEFTDYSGDREEWNDADASNKVKGSSGTSDFTITDTGELYGILVASAASGTSGILWATGAFDAPVPVASTDVFKAAYGIRT